MGMDDWLVDGRTMNTLMAYRAQGSRAFFASTRPVGLLAPLAMSMTGYEAPPSSPRYGSWLRLANAPWIWSDAHDTEDLVTQVVVLKTDDMDWPYQHTVLVANEQIVSVVVTPEVGWPIDADSDVDDTQ